MPENIKDSEYVNNFKSNIKSWIPEICPCRLCKVYLPQIGFIWLGVFSESRSGLGRIWMDWLVYVFIWKYRTIYGCLTFSKECKLIHLVGFNLYPKSIFKIFHKNFSLKCFSDFSFLPFSYSKKMRWDQDWLGFAWWSSGIWWLLLTITIFLFVCAFLCRTVLC